MISVLESYERYHSYFGWLDSWHTFSFGNHYHPERTGFRALRVINDDRVAAGTGFPTHPHRDMEIITWVLEGALEHKDSMGTGSVLRPGECQRMSAGTGVTHSEFNHSKNEPLHLYQIWIQPEKNGIKPGYEEKKFPEHERRNRLRVVASPDARDGSVKVHQDATLYTGLLDDGSRVEHTLARGRHAWLQVARGGVKLNGRLLSTGDGAAISDESRLEIVSCAPSELLLFDLA